MKEIWQNSFIVMTSLLLFSVILYFFTPYIRLEYCQYAEGSLLKEDKIEVNQQIVLNRMQSDELIYFKRTGATNHRFESARLYVVEGTHEAKDWQKLLGVPSKADEQIIVLPLNQWGESTYDQIKQQIITLFDQEGIEKITIFSEDNRYDWLLNRLTQDLQKKNLAWVIAYDAAPATFNPTHFWYHSEFNYLFYWSVNDSYFY